MAESSLPKNTVALFFIFIYFVFDVSSSSATSLWMSGSRKLQSVTSMTSLVTSSNTSMTSSKGFSPTFTNPKNCWVLNVGDFIPWNNPENMISQETEMKADKVIGLVSLCLCCVSVPCNILNMIVFWKHGLHVRINLCLFALSVADCLHMVFNFFYNVDSLYTDASEIGPVLGFFVGNHLVGLANVGWVSGFISTVIACERCLCVFSPLRSQTILKTKTTAVILVATIIPLVTGFMIIGLRWSLGCVIDLNTNTTFQIFSSGRIYAQNKILIDILSLVFGTFQHIFYVFVVMVTTIATSIQLTRMVSWRRETSSATLSSREVALTRTLIVISCLFVVCTLPLIITASLTMFVDGFTFEGRYFNAGKLCVSVYELGSYVNATFNFFVYCFLGSKYRQTLAEVLCCGKGRADKQQQKKNDQ